MNALLHEVIRNDWIDHRYLDDHTVGSDDLRALVEDCPPEEVFGLCGIEAEDLRRAARLPGTATALVSTVLQGFYQSHQATAAAVQRPRRQPGSPVARCRIRVRGVETVQCRAALRLHRIDVRPAERG